MELNLGGAPFRIFQPSTAPLPPLPPVVKVNDHEAANQQAYPVEYTAVRAAKQRVPAPIRPTALHRPEQRKVDAGQM